MIPPGSSGPADPKVVDLASVKAVCQSCTLRQLCLPMGIGSEDLETLDRIIRRRRPLQRGDHVFRLGSPLRSIYAIRSGCIKTYTITDSGSEQITGFHLPGELIGLDAIAQGEHPCTARALDTSSVCEIPYSRLEDIATRVPGLHRQLMRLMSRELVTDEHLLMVLGKKSAEQRLASLLVSLSNRLRERGFSAREFNLAMSRNDIANYLGLAVETISRLFTRFQQHGVLTVKNKLVEILDARRLTEMAGEELSPDQRVNKPGESIRS